MPILEAHDQKAPREAVAIAQDVMAHLEQAWNSANGAGFGEPFMAEADFVAIRGDLHSGRQAIAAGHQQIFDTIYAGSKVGYEVLRARELDDRVIVAHVRCTMNAPTGPFAGQHAATATVVLVREGDGYEIAAFHNTLVAEQPPASGD